MPNHETTIEDAVVFALARYLRSNLAPVEVIAEWPSADAAPSTCISIILTGPAEEELVDPYVVGSTSVNASVQEYTWAVAGLNLSIQLDVWALTASERSDLANRVRWLLKQGSAITLARPSGDPIANEVDLPLLDGFEDQYASFQAEPPDMSDDSDSVQRNEFRARFDIDATSTLTVKAQSPRMATIKFRQRMGRTLPSSGNFDVTTTTTTSGTTWTKNTP